VRSRVTIMPVYTGEEPVSPERSIVSFDDRLRRPHSVAFKNDRPHPNFRILTLEVVTSGSGFEQRSPLQGQII
jgi:hypothetical protein